MSEGRATPPYKSVDLTVFGPEHVRLYRETNGEQGYEWNGAKILLLTTWGRRSGQARTIPIIFTPHGQGWVVIASQGGAPKHPAWYLNLVDNPRVQVQVKGDVYEATARTALPPEREQLWSEAVRTWPNYNVYQSRTSREIPVVVLDPMRRP